MSTVLKWGLITGMVYIAFSLIGNLLGISEGGAGSMGLGFLSNTLLMLVTFFTIYLGVKETRDQDNGGYLTFGEGFLAGFKIALIASAIAGVFTLVYMQFIDPELMDRAMEGAEEQFEDMPEENREMAEKWTGIMTNPFVLAPFMMMYALV